MIFFSSSLFLTIIISYVLKKKNFLLNSSGNIHQIFTSSTKVPLTGGLILFFYLYLYLDSSNFTFFLIASIFVIGILSDIKKLNSPKIRLLLQTTIIFCLVYFNSFLVVSTKISFLDYLLNYYTYQLIFSIFCILIIVNGCNFIDGINTSLIGYSLIISLIMCFLDSNDVEVSKLINFNILIPVLMSLFLLNFLNKVYLGDSGAYLLGLIFSLYLIDTHMINPTISPFFIISLLWYPAFENLFSISRKIKLLKSPVMPDTNHLHQVIFLYFKKKYTHNHYLNTYTGMVINIYNLISISIATFFYNHTLAQLMIIIFNITMYMFLYKKLMFRKK